MIVQCCFQAAVSHYKGTVFELNHKASHTRRIDNLAALPKLTVPKAFYKTSGWSLKVALLLAGNSLAHNVLRFVRRLYASLGTQ
jgi:hypothetical protein